MEYQGLPLYKASLVDDTCGMYTISLVDFPATESDFLAFADEKKLIKFAVENEDKRIVRGLVMAADMPIYRISPMGYEYYITYDADCIRKMAEKYLKDGYQNNVDTNHNENLEMDCDMVQFFIKDTENGINPKGFEGYNDGSLFAEFHILNDEVWSKIKAGEFKGFSLAGLFAVEEIEDDEEKELEEVMSLIEKINKKLNKK